MPGRGAEHESIGEASYDSAIERREVEGRAASTRGWRHPTALQRILGGAVGAALGALVTVGLLLAGVGHWVVGAPTVIGAGVGAVYGDRGIRAIVRIVDALPFC